MIAEHEIESIVNQMLARSTADETEVSLSIADECNTRFSRNRIHQNMVEEKVSLRVRVMQGDRIGVAATTRLDEAAFKQVLKQAQAMARSGPNAGGLGFAAAGELCPVQTDTKPLQAIQPGIVGEQVRQICDLAADADMQAAGYFSVSRRRMGLGTSRGGVTLGSYDKSFLNVMMQNPSQGTSGWASMAAAELDAIESQALAREAQTKAKVPLQTGALPTGEVAALLDFYAVEEIISTLSVSAFNADAYFSGASVTSNRMGERVFAPEICIRDDAYDVRGCPRRFDADGVQKEIVYLVKAGMVAGVLHDRATAKRYAAHSTGHAQERPALYLPGPQAENLFLEPGDADQEQLLLALGRGVWITRFHYTSVLDPSDLTINGTTRDGTFWIENGQVKYALPNLSFRFSILEALQNVRAVGAEGRLLNGLFGVVYAPSIVVDKIHFC